MGAKKLSKSRPLYPEHWAVETRVQVNGRWLEPGTEVSVVGERGRFRFIRQVTNMQTGSVWLDFLGGAKGCTAFRSFHVEKIKTVHRLERMRKKGGKNDAGSGS